MRPRGWPGVLPSQGVAVVLAAWRWRCGDSMTEMEGRGQHSDFCSRNVPALVRQGRLPPPPPPTLQVPQSLCVPPPSRASLGSHWAGQAPNYVLKYAVLLKVSNSRSNIQKTATLVEKQTWRLFLKVSLQMLRKECFLAGIAQHPWMGSSSQIRFSSECF